jgi:hypothetical protein
MYFIIIIIIIIIIISVTHFGVGQLVGCRSEHHSRST